MRKFAFSLTLTAVFLLAAAVPGNTADTKTKPETKPGIAWFLPDLLTANNCTWTCGDGRTGGAEVNTEQQCANACSGACGTTCVAQ